MDHSPSDVKDLDKRVSAANLTTDENQQDQKPSTSAAAPENQPTAEEQALVSSSSQLATTGNEAEGQQTVVPVDISDGHFENAQLGGQRTYNLKKEGPQNQAQEVKNTEEQAQESSSSQLAILGNETGGQQTMMLVDISGGHFVNAQIGGHQTYNMIKEEHISVNNIQYGSTNVYNYYGAGPQNQAQEDKNTGDVFRLSDSIQIRKVKPLNERQTIFQGEQISAVTPARQLVVKFIPYNENNKREAKLLLKLERHPNVVSIIHSGVYRLGPMTFIYIAMEFCHEQNLHDNVTANNNVSFDPQLSISQAKQLVEGLNHIHFNNIIHRDLKPHNVLFSLDKKTLKFADFGISKEMTRGRTVTNVTAQAGTDGYRAPETYNSNEISKQADIFSLGLVLYFLWSNGHHAFGDDPDDWNRNIKRDLNRDLRQLLLGDQEMAMDVLQWSLQFNRKDRPKAAQILNHKIFGGTEISPNQQTSPKGTVTTMRDKNIEIVDNKKIQEELASTPENLSMSSENIQTEQTSTSAVDQFAKEQALVSSSSQLATTGNEAEGQQTVVPVDINDGHFENAQLGGHRTYNMTKKEHIHHLYHAASPEQETSSKESVGGTGYKPDQQQQQQDVTEEPGTSSEGSQNQAQEDKNTGDVFHLTDSILMHKDKPLNKKQTIFHGEQISTVTPAQHVVIKLIPYNKKNKQEAELLLKLNRHPNIVSIDHTGVCRQGPMTSIYIAMELCHEQDLHDHVIYNKNNNVPFDPQLSIFQAKQLVEGLSYIHSNNVIHRDLKPHNVLLSLDKKSLKIADFGISKPMTRGRTVTNVTNARAGTDGYRAPETYNSNEISMQADIFSLGLVFYFLWSNGHHAFGDDPNDWNSNIKKNRDRDLSQLLLGDQEMAMDVLQWSLQFNRKKRPKAAQILNHKIFGGTEISPNQQTSPKGAATTRRAKIVDNKTERPEPRSSQPKARNDNFELDLEKMIALQGKAELYMKHFEYQSAYKILKELQGLQGDSWKQFETLQQIIECLIMTDQPCDQEMNKIISTCQYLRLSPRDVHSTAEKYYEDDNLVPSYIMFHCAGKMRKTGGEVEVLSAITKCASRMDDILKKLIKKPRYRRVATSCIIPAMKDFLEDLREMDYVRSEENIVHEAECLHFVGSGYHEINDYGMALKYFEEGIQLLRDLGQEAYKYRLFSALLNNTGSSNFYLGRASEALPYHQEAAIIVEYAEDFPNEEQKQKSIKGIKHNLQTCMRSEKRTYDKPTFTEPKETFQSQEREYKFQSPSMMDESVMIETMISLREKSDLYLKHNEYSLACETLQQLIQLQVNPDEKLELLQQIGECQVMCGQPCDKEINTIITLCKTLRISANDLKPSAQEHFTESRLVRAYVMFVCISKIYKTDEEPSESLEGMRESVQVLRHVIEKMVKQPRLRRIVSSHVVPSMHEMLADIRRINNVSTDEKVENEALALNAIASGIDDVEEHEKAVQLYMEGMKLMEREFKANVTKCHVYGALLHNIGTSKCHQRKFAEAEKYYIRAIEAKQSALDFKSEVKKQSDVKDAKDSLARCRTLMKKFHQASEPKHQSSFQSEGIQFSSTEPKKVFAKPSTAFFSTGHATDVPRTGGVAVQGSARVNKTETDIKEMITLKENSQRYVEAGEYSLASEALKKLINFQEDSWSQIETLQQIVECQVMCNQPCDDEINKILSIYRSINMTSCEIRSTAEKHVVDSQTFPAYILLICSSKMFKYDTEPSEAVRYIRESVQLLKHILEQMIKKPRLRRIASSQVIPTMYQLLDELRQFKDVSGDVKVTNEALTLNAIASCHDEVDEYDKSLEIYNEAVDIMKREFGSNAMTCHVYGALLHNIGTTKSYQKKYDEALIYYEQSLEVGEKAVDWVDEDQREKSLAGTRNSLRNARTRIRKYT